MSNDFMVPVFCFGCGKKIKRRLAELRRNSRPHCKKSCRHLMSTRKAVARMWATSIKRGKCLLWSGPKNNDGYGMTSHNGWRCRAHILSWFLVNGKLPKNKCICHSCDMPSCINPEHLFVGSHLENMRDMRRKGRGFYKVTKEMADSICSSSEKTAVLAKKFNVAERTIRNYRNQISELPEPPK